MTTMLRPAPLTTATLFTLICVAAYPQDQTVPGNLFVSGKVSVGTTAQNSLLTLQDSVDASLSLQETGGSLLKLKAGTTGAYLFTPSSHPLFLGAQGSAQVLTIKNDRVGIGTTTPAHTLEVAGNVRVGEVLTVRDGASSYHGFGLATRSSLAPGDADANRPNGGNIYRINYHEGLSLSAHSYYGGIRFYNQGYSSSGANPYELSPALALAIKDGNVGIATPTPQYRLDVASTSSRVATNGYGGITFEQQSYPNQGALLFSSDRTGYTFVIGNKRASDSLVLPIITMFDTGNVGIGTTNPTHKLAVNGTGKFKEVIVETTGWSDYVFADGYELAPLDQVEAHIREHKHLPGIPSAAEVAEHGVSVGEMQAKLLAKIEELTLHAIAQEKRAEAQAAEIAQLRSRIEQPTKESP